jgi:cell division protein FtsW
VKEKKFDYTLFAIVLALLTLGVIMIYSASAFMAQERWNQSTLFFKKQLIWFILSVATIMIVSKINYHHWQKMAWPLMILSFCLLIYVFTQKPVNGARRWIFIFGNSLQPAEIFKYALVMFTALYLYKRPKMLDSLSEMIWPWGVFVAAGLAMILFQPDLGMVLVIITTVFIILFMAGLKYRYVLASLAVPVVLVIVMAVGFDYKVSRLVSFVDHESVTSTESYQVNQSLLAIGSGGIFGKGIGRGSAKLMHLPESHTDFIIANVAEEGGFLLISVCLAFYFVMILRGLKIASLAKDNFGFYLAFGIVTILTINIIINIGVATRLLPTTGMTLPFLSYGGSSLLCSAFGIGVLLNISRYQNNVSKVFVKRNG